MRRGIKYKNNEDTVYIEHQGALNIYTRERTIREKTENIPSNIRCIIYCKSGTEHIID